MSNSYWWFSNEQIDAAYESIFAHFNADTAGKSTVEDEIADNYEQTESLRNEKAELYLAIWRMKSRIMYRHPNKSAEIAAWLANPPSVTTPDSGDDELNFLRKEFILCKKLFAAVL